MLVASRSSPTQHAPQALTSNIWQKTHRQHEQQLQQHVALEQVLPVATVDPLHAEVQEQAVVQEDQDAEVRAVKVVHASSAQSLNTIRRFSPSAA